MKKSFKKYLSLVMVLMVAFVCLFSVSVKAASEVVATFEFGANGTASHNDGSEISAGKTYTEGNYSLKITSATKTYDGARDAKGNSCLKLGTSKLIGSFSFEVPSNVDKVVILVAQYKANTTKIKVNTATYNITTASNNGAYTEIEVDTSTEKVVTFSTVASNYRCMINTIVFYAAGDSTEPSISVNGGNVAEVKEVVNLTAVTENVTGTIVWSSSDEQVATVDQNGKVTAVAMGVATITATVDGVSDSIELTIYPSSASPITIVEAIEISKFAGSGYTPQKYTIEGTIKNVYNTQYGNMYITDGTNELCIYGLYSADGSVRYDAMTVKPVAGDKIRVTGILGQYNNTTNQMKNGWLLEIVEDPIDAILEQLNNVESYMSLAYTYTPVEGEEGVYDSVFRIRCGIDFAIADIEGVESFGIKVATSEKEKEYDETSEFWAEDNTSEEQCYYVVIDLGNLFAADERFEIEFTVSAYVVVDGEIYYSEFEKTFSVAYLVAYYYESLGVEQVKPLYDLLLEMGKIE